MPDDTPLAQHIVLGATTDIVNDQRPAATVGLVGDDATVNEYSWLSGTSAFDHNGRNKPPELHLVGKPKKAGLTSPALALIGKDNRPSVLPDKPRSTGIVMSPNPMTAPPSKFVSP